MTELRLVKDEKKVEIDIKIKFNVESHKMSMHFADKLAKFCLDNSKNVAEFESYSIINVKSFKYT